jgi:hypothetical protein
MTDLEKQYLESERFNYEPKTDQWIWAYVNTHLKETLVFLLCEREGKLKLLHINNEGELEHIEWFDDFQHFLKKGWDSSNDLSESLAAKILA